MNFLFFSLLLEVIANTGGITAGNTYTTNPFPTSALTAGATYDVYAVVNYPTGTITSLDQAVSVTNADLTEIGRAHV